MKSRKVPGGWLIRLGRGEEALATLTAFAVKNKIPCGFLQGIGAINSVELGYFDLRHKKYRRKKINRTVEVISLLGNISWVDKKPFVHAHITIAGPDQKLLGGHFFKGTVAVTLEIYLQVVRRKLKRYHDSEVGFNFWDL